MKVYVVMEEATIAFEDYERVMGVFSSEEKASEAAYKYAQRVKDSCWHHSYYWIEREIDKIWEDMI